MKLLTQFLVSVVLLASALAHAAKPVAFAALIKDKVAAQKAVDTIAKHHQALKNAGIDQLHFYQQTIAGKEVILATMDLLDDAPEQDAEKAWQLTTKSPLFKESFSALEKALTPHPRVKAPAASPWVETETICVIRPNNAAAAKIDSPWFAAVTALKKEKEAEYRLLHSNVWPGVIKAIGKSNISRFDIFLIEFGDNQPYLFYLFQYTGTNFEKDMAAQPNSPVNQRWWKFTDACQEPLPEADGSPWLNMKDIAR